MEAKKTYRNREKILKTTENESDVQKTNITSR